MPAPSRAILHLDMDAFFAAIAQRDDPSLRGKAILTGHDGPRAVVTTASYEARRFGCRSAMPMSVARRLCPHAIVVHVPGRRIREVSERLFDLLHEVTPLVEPVSVDEAFLDVTGTERLLGDPVTVARRLKDRVAEVLGLTASVGVSFNKFLAKLASDLDKPDGLTVIGPDDVTRVLDPLPLERVWGVGPAAARRLHERGLRTIADLRRVDAARLRRWFGSAGQTWHRLARGLDDRPVVPDHQARSIGQEQTFPEDVADRAWLRAVLLGQVEQVGRRLRRHGLRARGVTVKIRFGDFQTVTRSAALPHGPSDLTDDLWHAAAELFDRWCRERFSPVRLLGVAADRLSTEHAQLTLFPDPARQRRQQLDRTLDQIAERFGPGSIHRGPGAARTDPTSPHDPRLRGE